MRGLALAFLLTFGLAARADEGAVTTYCNPLPVLLADPHVLRHEGTYYMYATSDVLVGYFAWSSKDLVHWEHRGHVFQKTETGWARFHFWAPEVVEKEGTFYLFYSASPSFEIHAAGKRICLATADSPLGPFRDARAPLFDSIHDSIDAHCFFDDDGQAYLYFVLEHRGNKVFVAPLSADLLTLTATPTFCIAAERPWESAGDWHVNEGPVVVKRDGWYYLFFSGNGFSDPNYAVGYATARSPLGPWTKYSGNPILSRRPGVSGPGHNTLIRSPDGAEWFSVHHTHMWHGSGGRRQLAIDRVRWIDEATGPARVVCDGPTLTPQPLPSGARPFARAQGDDFAGQALNRAHWIVFNESPELFRLEDGALLLRPSRGDVREQDAGLHNVFLQYAPEGDFSATLQVREATGAFLTLWRDHDHFVRLGVSPGGRELFAARELNGKWEETRAPWGFGDSLRLRLTRKGRECRLAASADGETWREVGRYEFDLPQPMIGMGATASRRGDAHRVRFERFDVEP